MALDLEVKLARFMPDLGGLVGAFGLDAVTDGLLAHLLEELLAIGVIGVDGPGLDGLEFGEEAALGQEVVLEVLVVVQVVAAQVGEGGALELDPQYPFHFQRVGRDFHDRPFAVLAAHLVQELHDGERGRRGVVGFVGLGADLVSDGADEARFLPRPLQDGADEVSGGGLALGAGHADDLHLFGRVAVIKVGKAGQGFPAVLDDHLRGRDPLQGVPLHHHRPSSQLQGFLGIDPAIDLGARDADEKLAGVGGLGILGDAGQLGVALAHQLHALHLFGQGKELHEFPPA